MSGSIYPYGRTLLLSTLMPPATGPDAFSYPCYVALCRIVPAVGSNGTDLAAIEPSRANGYIRVTWPFNNANWKYADPDTLTNIGYITFPGVAVTPWGWVGAWALTTAQTGGEVYASGVLLNGRTIKVGDQAQFPPSTIRLGLRG